ncbi:unnamed protein product [Sphagnum balticum]
MNSTTMANSDATTMTLQNVRELYNDGRRQHDDHITIERLASTSSAVMVDGNVTTIVLKSDLHPRAMQQWRMATRRPQHWRASMSFITMADGDTTTTAL